MIWPIAAQWLGAYLIASLPFGLIVGRALGKDVRQSGSGNIGATNVGRVLGRGWGALVLMLDALKGAAPMLATGYYVCHFPDALPAWGLATADLVRLGCGAACIVGAVAPLYVGFRGGKGVAISLGIVLAVPHLMVSGLAAGALFLIVRWLSGYVSLASVSAAVFLPAAFWTISRLRTVPMDEHYPLLILTMMLTLVVLFRHQSNIRRLIAGTEPRKGKPQR
jgi:glycerol-3-phosphate acyltransferase PlsY